MTKIVNKRPEGYIAIMHSLPLSGARAIAAKHKDSVIVNRGKGKYSVLEPAPRKKSELKIEPSEAELARAKMLRGE